MIVNSKPNIRIIEINKMGVLGNQQKNIILRWLGQAGFAISYRNNYLMIDPYLSDFLAQKYKGQEFPHIRLMAAPIQAEKVRNLRYVLCTHGHSDHLDPLTLPVLLNNNPNCKIVAPLAIRKYVISLNIDESRISSINANQSIHLVNDISLQTIPSAHEQIRTNDEGQHYFLGYIIQIGNIRIYHSGDCVPYVGLEEELKKKRVDIGLLPVNGRDEFRRSRCVAGNFTADEAVKICQKANIPIMICHHFGMFAFNTVDKNWLTNKAKAETKEDFRFIVPNEDVVYEVERLNE
jgi:L-ascorbate metabolism protein UlaG (beta-lactamase superfamily)